MLDRLTGELLSADPYAHVTWASGVDLKTGRPIETPQARYTKAVSDLSPGPPGAHNWQPMSFSPLTGLVYIPAQSNAFAYAIEPTFNYTPGAWNRAVATGSLANLPRFPADEAGRSALRLLRGEGRLA